MRDSVDRILQGCGGAASRARLLEVLTRNQLDDEIARGHLIAPFPRAYCRPWDVDQPAILATAALASVDQPAALSHVTALRRWGLPCPRTSAIHVTVPVGRHPVGRRPGLYVHRTRRPLVARQVGGLPTVPPATAIVRSWPMLTGSQQRAPAIVAARKRLVTPTELRDAAALAIGLSGRSQLIRLVGLIESGCESELELWGHLHVFDHPGLRHGRRQFVLQIRGRWYRADLGYPDERVAIEMDGARYHASADRRERDLERDAAFASIDWLTVRFSEDRLTNDPVGCQRDSLAVLAARRAWRRSA